MVYVFLAYGFEEIEAITAVDVLRRAEIEVKTVGIGNKTVTGAHGITIHCDMLDREVSEKNLQGIVLPGGMPGATNLQKSKIVDKVVTFCHKKEILIAAICAAPIILGEKGLLEGRKATVFPGMEDQLKGAILGTESVVEDGKIITANGPASALEFSLKIVQNLLGEEIAKKIGGSMQCRSNQ